MSCEQKGEWSVVSSQFLAQYFSYSLFTTHDSQLRKDEYKRKVDKLRSRTSKSNL